MNEGGVLQGGKNAVNGVNGVEEAYLSDGEPNSISDDAVNEDEYAVSGAPLVDFLETPPAWFRVQASKHFDNPSAASLTPLCHAAAQRAVRRRRSVGGASGPDNGVDRRVLR
jgi:hypothetical protein